MYEDGLITQQDWSRSVDENQDRKGRIASEYATVVAAYLRKIQYKPALSIPNGDAWMKEAE